MREVTAIMNQKRRGILREVVSHLRHANELLFDVCEDEDYTLQNTPENFQSSERFQESEEALSTLQEANDAIDSAIDQIESVI